VGISGEVLRRNLYHHEGPVFTRPILRCGVEKAAGHIQYRIGVAVDPDAWRGLVLGVPAWVGFGWWWSELILGRVDRRQHHRSFLLRQPDPEIDHAVLALMPRHFASGLLAYPQTISGPETRNHPGQLGGRGGQRQPNQPGLINHIDNPGDLPHLRIRQSALPKQFGNRRHAAQSLRNSDVFPRNTWCHRT
jgi:hypothetical protein